MVYLGGVLFVLEITLVIYCLLNAVTTPPDQVRNLPKLLWVAMIVLLPLAGSIAWLLAGRPAGALRSPLPAAGGGRTARRDQAPAVPPDDDEAFLRGLRERADQQRAEAQRRKDEADERKENDES